MSLAPATPAASYKMLNVEDAQMIILENTKLLNSEIVPLSAACGRILADTILAPEPVPGYRASIKDGYAVRSSDGPGEYPVAFSAHAGTETERLPPGSVAYISTGGPVPDGADAVVQIEDTEFSTPSSLSEGGRVKIKIRVPPGCDIRPIGSDMAQGEPVLFPGDRIGPAEVGILATVGTSSVAVYRTPHVAVLSTGDEVCEPDAPRLAPGQVRDANRAMLLAAAASHGAKVTDLGIVKDSMQLVEAAVDRALDIGADILLTSGGVSMGDKDFIKPLLESRGTVYFGKICMKPGKPLTFAELRSGVKPLLVFGLPGNPVSSIVTFALAVLPCMRKMEGWKEPLLRRIHVKTCMNIKMDPVRPEYHRAVVSWSKNDGLMAESTGGQISSRLLSSKSANVLLEIPKKEGILPAGSIVSALIVGDLGAMPQPVPPPDTTHL